MVQSISTNTFGLCKWIVSSDPSQGTHTTIAAALSSASSGDTIGIRSSSTPYIENLNMKAGISLVGLAGDESDNVTIQGTITCSFAGSCEISGIHLKTNGAAFLALTSGSIAYLMNCNLDCTNSTGITCDASACYLYYCTGFVANTGISLFASSNSSFFYIFNTNILNTGASSTASTAATGTSLYINDSYLAFPVTTSDTSLAVITNTSFIQTANATSLTANGTGGTLCDRCYFQSGTASAISIGSGASMILSNATVLSTNTNPITGLGALQYTSVDFTGSGITPNTTTLTPLNVLLGNIQVKKITMQSGLISNVTIPGAYPYTTLATDYVILVDSSSARTITLISSPATGTTYRIKDNGGLAGTNNITVDGNGKNIDGAATYLMDTNYQSIDLTYNGTQWNIL